MDIDDLRALLSVLEHGSVQAASRATRVPRTTLRRQLDNLEARVGVPLLVRGVAGAEPTEAGRAVATGGRAIIEETAAMLAAVRNAALAPTGELRVLMPVGLPPQLSALVLSLFWERFPRLTVRYSTHDDPLSVLRDEVDLVLHFGEPPQSGAWLTTTLARTPERLLASASYLERFGVPTTTAELADHTLLSWRGPQCDPLHWPLRAGGVVSVSPMFVSHDVHLLRVFAGFGHGIVLAPDGGVPDGPDIVDTLVPVLPDVVGRDNALRAMVPAATAELPRGRSLLALIRDLMAVLNLPGGGG